MAHDWEDVSWNEPPVTLNSRRRCKNCGLVQTKEAEYLWMRVTGYRWVPLVGRCKGKKDEK